MLKKIYIVIAILIAAGLSLLGYAYFIEPGRLVVQRSTIFIKDWNPAFDGLRIVMISDVHGGSNFVTEERLREIVKKINEQQPDVVFMLGDYVSQLNDDKPLLERDLKMPIETIAENLRGIEAKYGVFAVLGNHDGWYGDASVAAELSQAGYRVLQNEVAVIEKDGERLIILGFKDHLTLAKTWLETSAQAKEILSPTGEGDVIVLEHSPDIMPMITGQLSISNNLRLVLAGHTHGGQMWFPIFGTPVVPSMFGQKYARGHVKENGVDLFVTSGIGMSVLPVRFMVPPEIVVLTVKTEVAL